ncbi:hypothetical protein [Thiorhodovibrio frisius]|uniref:Uncharacterized protein n=1 Tax=Thiorhodovibrio frisius TaxID=631362 RepID=H8Z6Y3_9GAMM|nr:hypothetical protein [Thiorhodovibrio frisius]EIC19768.1 hypothetical protein Thi970DRAFT_03365 [Thiorhodovibrio frisius]WPL20262.1 hypothetical protein Thiofri_00342 [Thiorhodovibrio frisius]
MLQETLQALRDKHGQIEPWWRAEHGYGFDTLTESEGRYLLPIEHAECATRYEKTQPKRQVKPLDVSCRAITKKPSLTSPEIHKFKLPH